MEEFLKFGRLKRGCEKIQGGAMALPCSPLPTPMVNHVIDHNAPNGFITEDFTKLTALNRTFLSGKAVHLFFCEKNFAFFAKITQF